MCGRFALYAGREQIAAALGLESLPGDDVTAGYNIPPGTWIPTLQPADREDPTPYLARSFWGFRPPHAGQDAPRPINARAERAATSRYFRDAFTHRRCLVPASGWIEWQQASDRRQPYYITAGSADQPPVLLLAALYAPLPQGQGTCCAVLTEPARGTLERIHPRQPVVLDPACARDWLDPRRTERDEIRRAARPLDAAALQCRPISTRINSPQQDDARLLEAVDPPPAPDGAAP